MQVVANYIPLAGLTQTINLLQQSGFTEVINDSNMLLIVQTNNGQCYQVAGTMQIYPTPIGGGIFQIKAQPFYLLTDLGIANTITVNQYLEGELAGRNYPCMLTRTISPGVNIVAQSLPSVSVANLAAGAQVSVVGIPPGVPANVSFYLTGVDLSIDQETTTHGWTLNITGLINPLVYVGHTKTATDTQLLLRWQGQDALVSVATGSNINVVASVPAITGSTSRAALCLYGYYQ